ncbi:ferredoxin--NADP reductase [Chlorobium sp. N1]|uniref:ferredoxin--NADP reductase n=1 Tax=Chlorobium sp. N1 TaxID=2491138 RepID=UPI00103D897B|nr:ferredoxin--NADP reductase [Chlorobium sp. N1]TCD47123.1 ferredoxin--NADP reductase [Chlorobium sp. N1]
MHHLEYNATVRGTVLVSADSMVLSIEADQPRRGFDSGQYVLLGLYGSEPRSLNSLPDSRPLGTRTLIQRPYAIASHSAETSRFEFFITQVRSGELTPRLFALEPGARLHLGEEIRGSFLLNETPDGSDIIMIATGTGIAPYISFLRTHIADRPESKMVVIQGASHEEDLGYSSELRFLEKRYPNFFYVPTLTDPDEQWQGRRVRVEDLLQGELLQNEFNITPDPEWTHFFISGNPVMVRTVSGWLEAFGYSRHHPDRQGEYYIEEY